MHISKLTLVNYRNFKKANFHFKNGVNTILGENGSGKTNAFRAMRLLLDPDLIKYAYNMSGNDFNRGIGDWRGHWIIISLEFDEISDDEEIQSLFLHGTGNLTPTTVNKATYNLFFRPNKAIRKKLSEIPKGDTEALQDIIDEISIDDYEAHFTGKSNADFTDENIYKEIVGDFINVDFPDQIDENKLGVRIPHQLSVSKVISFTFIKALRDVVSEFHNNRTNPLFLLLKAKSDEINQADFSPIVDKVKQLNEDIESLNDIKTVKDNIQETVNSAVGHSYSPSSLSITSHLPDEAEKLFQSLKLFVGEPDDNHEGALHELSLGGANIIYLTLKLLLFKYSTNQSIANFLIIEEPEAHIHTHIQKALFEKLNYPNTQIIYSTHSTHISEASKISRMNILSNSNNHAEVFNPTTGLTEDKYLKLERYLDAVRSTLLFAKGVVLIEGDAEQILIPTLVKKVFGVNLDELGISLINIGSVGFENIAQIFHENRLRRNCSIITDLDTAIIDTTIQTGDSDTIKKRKNKYRKAAQLGQTRKENLDNLHNSNPNVKPFYAEYTFETDFIKSGNGDFVKLTVPEVYVDANTISLAETEICSANIEDYGRRILTMADNKGKGWYALILADKITNKTIIPDYILNAIAFACKKHLKKETIVELLDYRINQLDPLIYDVPTIKDEKNKYINSQIDLEGLKSNCQMLISSDPIVKFLNQITL